MGEPATPSLMKDRQAAGILKLGRYPGPVWTLVIWIAISGANLAFALFFPGNNKPPTPATMSVLAFAIVSTTLLLVMGSAVSRRILRLLLLLTIFATGVLVHSSLTPLGPAVTSWSYAAICLYAALWERRRNALGFWALCSLSYLAVLFMLNYQVVLLVNWMIVSSITLAMVLLLTYLVRQLHELAHRDELTGLLNRTALNEVLSTSDYNSFYQPNRLSGQEYSIALIDLDGFKLINDLQGHHIGDVTLQQFAQFLQQSVQSRDLVFRLGGDEFLVICQLTPADQLAARLDGLARSGIAYSYGITSWTPPESFSEALSRADSALYQAKPNREPEA